MECRADMNLVFTDVRQVLLPANAELGTQIDLS